MTETYSIPNGDRVTRFEGDLLGSSTSRRGDNADALRWTEVEVFKTKADQYVLHVVGASSVFHAGPNACTNSRGQLVTGRKLRTALPEEKLNDLVACPVCQPNPDPFAHDQLIVERDAHSVTVSRTAEALIAAAHNTSPEGVVYMTKTMEKALVRAARKDERLEAAFLVETIA